MDGKTIQCLSNPSHMYTHLSSTVSQLFEPQMQRLAVFTYRSPYFCFPWRRPYDYHPICSMDGKTIQCLPNPSQQCMYLSIFDSFRVTRRLNQCVGLSPKIAILPHFCFPWGPWAITLNAWKENLIDAYKLSRCMCPSNYNRF